MMRAPMLQPACQGIQAKVNGMVGDSAPLGFFDPLGFSKEASPASMAKCVQWLPWRVVAHEQPEPFARGQARSTALAGWLATATAIETVLAARRPAECIFDA